MSQTFTPTTYMRRINTARDIVTARGGRGLVVPTGMLMRYLTGLDIDSHERLTALVISANATTLISPAVDVPVLDEGLNITQASWPDGTDPYRMVADALGEGSGPVVVGMDLTADHLLRLQRQVGTDMELAEDVLGELTHRKDADEVVALTAAGQAIDRVHAAVPQLLQPGVTEADVAEQLAELILEEHDEIDFIIVGSGPNGALPHHSYSDRVLEAGDMVVVDIGGTMPSGYHSDCTRTYQVPGADLDPQLAHIYEVLGQAQRAALAAARPGVKASDVDAAARTPIEDAGLGEYFIHRTGHGIGLSTHEEPFIAAGNDLVLAEGMCFSIEPGIYLPGIGGARIEDIVTVTADGITRLNSRPRTLDASPES